MIHPDAAAFLDAHRTTFKARALAIKVARHKRAVALAAVRLAEAERALAERIKADADYRALSQQKCRLSRTAGLKAAVMAMTEAQRRDYLTLYRSGAYSAKAAAAKVLGAGA